jgi:hypothetical protein
MLPSAAFTVPGSNTILQIRPGFRYKKSGELTVRPVVLESSEHRPKPYGTGDGVRWRHDPYGASFDGRKGLVLLPFEASRITA